MIKNLVKHGHSRAIVIDKKVLEAAGLSENATFQVAINPNGGLIIQSVDAMNNERFEKHYQDLNVELFELMKSLSKK